MYSYPIGMQPCPCGYLLMQRQREEALKCQMHMLWEQHDVWTRATIVSLVFGLPDVDAVTNRLLRNPVDFGTALAPFYGTENASKFTSLLTDHLTIAAKIVKAAKAGDNKTAAEEEKKWYANADEIATFFAKINPYWSFKEWQSMLHDHLKLVKREAVDLLTKDYAGSIATYDEIEKQSLMMADTITNGIIRQFPNKF